MIIKLIPIARIDMSDRLRALNPIWVEAMARDIQAGEVLPPIEVVETGDDTYRLAAGALRVAATSATGANEIEARVWPASAFPDERALRLKEIRENIVRYELTVLDRSVAILAWKEIYDASKPLPKRGRKAAAQASQELIAESAKIFAERFSMAAARALDISERSVHVALQIASGITEESRLRISVEDLANRQAELLQLSHQDGDRQSAILDLLLAPEPKAATIAEAIAILDKVPAPIQLAGWQRVSDRFSRLTTTEQDRFFAAHAEAVERWYAARLVASKTRRSA
jgi:ParB family chromosome partitioning protein